MENENNPHKTKQIPTPPDLIRIFMQYPNQNYYYSESKLPEHKLGPIESFKMGDPDGLGMKVFFHGDEYFRAQFHLLKVEVKPLEKIFDSELLELYEKIFGHDEDTPILIAQPEIMKQIIQDVSGCFFKDWHTKRVVNPSILVRLIDTLREMGFAMPYKNWSVDQLVKFGIYKLID